MCSWPLQMMSSPQPRKRVSQACKTCSAKKVKCDGELPICRTCTLYNRECAYGTSKRNTRLNRLSRSQNQQTEPSVPAQVENATPNSSEFSVNLVYEPSQETAVSVSVEDSTRLFQTYFACIHPIWPVLYKPLYESMSFIQLTKELPRSLMFAMFAIAVCIRYDPPTSNLSEEDVPHEISDPVGRASQFLDAALSELQRTGDNKNEFKLVNVLQPSIASCQALVLLALQQHGVAEFSRAAVLCGWATSMAIELRLYRDCWGDDPVQKEVSSRLWWNLYVLDNMLSCEMGRPVTLRAEEADAPYPSVSESDEFELFTPSQGRRPFGHDPVVAIKIRTLSAFHTTIDMIKLMERVSREIYSLAARNSIRRDRTRGDATRMKLSHDILEWERQVEASPLRLDLTGKSVTLPAIVTNYVVIKATTILLHRPFISHWQSYLETSSTPPFPTLDPSSTCIHAAKEICTILENYSEYMQRLPCDLIFCIFTAAGTLLHHLRQNSVEHAETQRCLRLCFHWLSIFGKNWKNAGARQQLLNEWYDLPANLKGQPVETTSNIHTPAPEFDPNFITALNTDMQLDEGQFADILETVEDWGFLNDFGDASNNFYPIDTMPGS